MVRFEPIPEKNGDVLTAVMAEVESLVSDQSLLFKIRLSTEEIVENICNYSTSPFVEVSTTLKDGILSMVFCDSGIPFNPLDRKDPDISAALEDRQIGGLGIFLCKQMMDTVAYEYTGGCNIFSMTIKTNN